MRKLAILLTLVLVLCSSAFAEQKNVQVLTGLTDYQLQRDMDLMRASLGVNCDYCHVFTETHTADFPNDAKQTKRTARRMIEMVEQINQQNFEGKPVVSCMSCHRGNTDPVSLPPLPQAVIPFPTPARTRPANLPTREQIVAKYLAALGDASRLTAPRTLAGTRETADGKSTPFDVQISGDKVHASGTTRAGATEQVVSGTSGWIKTPTGVNEMRPDLIETYRELTAAYELTAPQSIPADARVVNTEKIGDHDTFVVVARVDDRTRQRLYFDTTTGLLVRRVVLRQTDIGQVPQQTDFDDYREVGATKYPFYVRVSLLDPFLSATRHYTDVRLGAKIDDEVFAPLKSQ
ncbi:MAG TPA: c-type cytochrome [Thermoanaerobaculia bacterium]|nr:c-type cytochrome [Thermoanaerobaculia bacterium]